MSTLAAGVSSAAIITFSNKATFLTTTSATDATGALPLVSLITGSYTVGSVTFNAPKWQIGLSSPAAGWSTLLPGNEIAISQGLGNVGGVANDGLDATFATTVYSAGFDFVEPTTAGVGHLPDGCNTTPCIDSTYLVTLFNGATSVGSFSFNAPNDVAAFIGVASDTAFNRLAIRETTGSDDNEYYGHFYAGSVNVVVPVPAAAWLFGSALAGLGVLKRRQASG